MWVSGGFGGTTPWVAWPPPGFYPMELHEVAYQTIDETGWTLQSDVKSLDGAQAQVTQNGQDMPVEVVELAANYGSFDALKITPQGWTMQTGAAYEVVVTTPSEVIAYSFQAVDCHGLLNP